MKQPNEHTPTPAGWENSPTPKSKKVKKQQNFKNKIKVQNGGINQKAKNTRKHQKLIEI